MILGISVHQQPILRLAVIDATCAVVAEHDLDIGPHHHRTAVRFAEDINDAVFRSRRIAERHGVRLVAVGRIAGSRPAAMIEGALLGAHDPAVSTPPGSPIEIALAAHEWATTRGWRL